MRRPVESYKVSRMLGMAPEPINAGSLDGLLVADFSRVLAGPIATVT